MKVLFIGSNPSRASKTTLPMDISTRSRVTINKWLHGKTFNVAFVNIMDSPTDNNRPLSKIEMLKCLVSLKNKIELEKPDKIIALGQNASWVLIKLRIEHFAAPHPSGLCRKWNNSDFCQQFQIKLDEYLSV